MRTIPMKAGGSALPLGDARFAVFAAFARAARPGPAAASRKARDEDRSAGDKAYCRETARQALDGPGTAAAGIPMRGIAPHL